MQFQISEVDRLRDHILMCQALGIPPLPQPLKTKSMLRLLIKRALGTLHETQRLV